MSRIARLAFTFACVLALTAGTAACGDDGAPTDAGMTDSGGGVDSGGGTDGGETDSGAGTDGGGTDGGDTDGAVSDGGTDGATGDAGAMVTGCADGSVGCTDGLMCCSGVPYPTEGICLRMCTMRSDRHAKEQITPVDSEALLERVAALPIAEWSYIDEQGVRHVGPMAQDFHASFGLGADDRSIHPVDAAGVTLAAVQALARRVEGLERDNGALRAHNAELSQRLEVLEGH